MKKFIGGLLMVTLMSSPSVLKVDYLAYEVLKTQKQIIYVIRKEMEGSEKSAVIAQIDEIMSEIDTQQQNITSLLKHRNKLTEKIQTALDLRAHTKTPLDDTQLTAFAQFTEICGTEGSILSSRLNTQERLNEAKSEILHNNTDCEALLSELRAVHDDQCEAVYSLGRIIETGERTLQAL
jgi:peptidoglycan hydrolase CwlO-like protein